MTDQPLHQTGLSLEQKSQHLKSCNLDYLYKMSSGDESFVLEMIKLFLKQVPMEVEKLSEIATDSKQVKQIAHKLKSSVSMLGAEDLLSDIKELESKANNGVDSATVISYQQVLLKKLDGIKEELNTLLS